MPYKIYICGPISGHGFAEIYQDDDYFKVDNKGIINYRIV